MKRTIVALGTLDTKGTELEYVRDLLKEKFRVIVVDTGIRGSPQFEPDVTRQQVANAAGTNIEDIVALEEEAKAIEMMAAGATKIVQGLYDSGHLDGIIAIGGSLGTAISTAAMRALPFGVPKVMVSTMASGDTRAYIGTKDIIMFPSVSDIIGLNRITRRVLSNAVNAISGMVAGDRGAPVSDRSLIAITSMGGLTPCTLLAKTIIEEKGYEVVVFHTSGIGGQALEQSIDQRLIDGVLELSVNELVSNLLGGSTDAGASRLEAAGRMGIPQVVVPGISDLVFFTPPQTMPEKFKQRKVSMHNPTIAMVPLNSEEIALVGRLVAEKLNRATGSSAIIIPKGGFSPAQKSGRHNYDPELVVSFTRELKASLKPQVILGEVDAHINDTIVAEQATSLLLDLLKRVRKPV